MPSFSASPQSSSAIRVDWSLLDVDPGHEIVGLTITQTAPNGTSTPQNFQIGQIVQAGTTEFTGLQPATTYTYVIYAQWDDGNVYNPEPGTTATTLALHQGGSAGSGSGSGTTIPQVALPPGKITGLTANWNAPAYTDIKVDWIAGSDTTSTMAQALSGAGKKYQSPWATLPFSSKTEGMTATFPNMPPDSYTITVIDADGTGSEQVQTTASTQVSRPPGPGAITGFTAAWNNDYTAIVLTWSQASGTVTATTGMQLQRYAGQYSSSATPQENIKVPLTSPYTDTPTTIAATSEYQYQLTASNTFGTSSAVSNLLSPPKAPAAPSHVVAKWTVEYTKAAVSWNASAHAENYEVLLFRVDLNSGITKIEDHTNIQTTSFEEPLTGEILATFQYQVIAHNKFGSSPPSAFSNGLGVPMTAPPPQSSGPSTLPGPHTPVIRNQSGELD
jgi:hypothetical protein